MAEKRPTYAGRIKNSGVQKVEAPFATSKKSLAVVKNGDDLRCGNGKKK